jgi:hypothetical protein
MEAFMQILVSVIALAVALAWSSAGEAQQSKQSSVRGTTVAQKQVQRPRTVVRQGAVQRPCAGYVWWGCVGWDPDPNVRATLVRDYTDDD